MSALLRLVLLTTTLSASTAAAADVLGTDALRPDTTLQPAPAVLHLDGLTVEPRPRLLPAEQAKVAMAVTPLALGFGLTVVGLLVGLQLSSARREAEAT